MPLNLILAVGKNPALQEGRSSILRRAGYIVDSEYSVKDAVERFKQGDFDLVLLCDSMPIEDRDRLTRSIRAFGSLTPIVSVAPPSGRVPQVVEDVISETTPEKLLSGVMGALLKGAAFYRSRDRQWAFYY